MRSPPNAKLKDVPGVNAARQNQPGPTPQGPAGHLLLLLFDAFNHFYVLHVGLDDPCGSLTHFGEATSAENPMLPKPLPRRAPTGTVTHKQGTTRPSPTGTARPQAERVSAASADVPVRNPEGLVFTTALFIEKQLNLFKGSFSLRSDVFHPSAATKAL